MAENNNTQGKLFIAELETPHFSFIATGMTEREAESAMREGWKKHCKQCKVVDNWDEWQDSVGITEVTIGKAYRNHSEL